MRFSTSTSIAILALLLAGSGCSGGGGNSGGTGGSNGTGGAMASGGTTNSGGATASGGAVGSGGATTSSGGAPGPGGAMSSGGATSSGGVSGPGGGAGTAGAAGSMIGSGGGGGRGGGAGGAVGGGSGSANAMMNFFVTSDTSATGNLGGLAASDARCQRLATAVGHGAKTWRAYLSVENPPTNAIDRIGAGPYYNSKGVMLAVDKTALNARAGNADVFLTELGAKVNGQWTNSPMPNKHDVLTGTQRNGTLYMGRTCGDWTAATGTSQVGHADGLGPGQDTSGTYSFWNSAHDGNCASTADKGGAGRLYCFVAP
ncbi:MAG: hypothetical protein ABI560_11130 [Myxococcales bacterium]